MRGRHRPVRVALALGVITASGFVPGGPAVQAQMIEPGPLEIFGTGDDFEQLIGTRFANALATSRAGLALTFSPQGGRDGRGAWARGENDFVVAGRRRTAADDAALIKRNTTAIEAPLAVSAMALVYVPPEGAPLTFSTPGPTEDDPATITPFTPPLKLPAAVAAGAFALGGRPPLDVDPLITPLYAPNLLVAQSKPTSGVSRSDPGASNYYLQQYMQESIPDQFALSIAQARTPFTPPAESWYSSGSRSGDAAMATVAKTAIEPSTGTTRIPLLVPLTPVRANQTIADQLSLPRPVSMYVAALQNGLGQWVQPTTESISKSVSGAVAAAGSNTPEPLWGLKQTVPEVDGAYPLSWISSIHVQATGLPVDKTNALATLIRYGASDAAAADAVALGEGILPGPLRLKAFAAADQVVSGNCVGPGLVVQTAADGGPYWPQGLGVPGGGSKICVDTTPPPTTTTTETTVRSQPTTSGTVSSQSDSGAAGAQVESTGTVRPNSAGSDSRRELGQVDSGFEPSVEGIGDTSEVAAGLAPGTPLPPTPLAAAASKLPLGMPDDGRETLDRLTTMLMGGVGFLLVRGWARKRRVTS